MRNKKKDKTLVPLSRPLKIAIVTERFPCISETFIADQVAFLIAQGHLVTVFALSGRDDDLKSESLLAGISSHAVKYSPERCTKPIPAIVQTIRIVTGSFLRNPRMGLALLNPARFGTKALRLTPFFKSDCFCDLRESSFDVIHAQFGVTGLWTMAFMDCGLISGPLVTHFRGWDISKFLRDKGTSIYSRLFDKGDFFLANCDHFKKRLIDLGCDQRKVAVLRSGIDLRKFPYSAARSSADGPIRIMSVGRLVEKKGFVDAVSAISSLVRAGENIDYKIVGDGPLKVELNQQIQLSGMARHISLVGSRDPASIARMLKECDLFVASSVIASDGDEDAPVNTLKEAMASGRPVVATKHGGIPELVESGISGFLVPERDSDALANAIARLIADPRLWRRFGFAGRRRVERDYDIEKISENLLDVYLAVSGIAESPNSADPAIEGVNTIV